MITKPTAIIADLQKYPSPGSIHKLIAAHFGILLTGCLLGFILAYFFLLIPFDFSGSLERARKLGIVSSTTLSGYSKTSDVLNFFAVTFFPISCSLTLWYLWARGDRKKYLAKLFDIDLGASNKDSLWAFFLFFVVAFYLLVSFNINSFYQPTALSTYIHQEQIAFNFLWEEGQFLAWTQRILEGGIYGRDFFCLYGPMMIYPLAWFMKFFGVSIPSERAYTYLTNLAAYAIIIHFLYFTLRNRSVFLLSSLIFILFYSPFRLLSLNGSHLRITLGLLPLFLMYYYLETSKKYLLPIIGIIAGQSLFFSQEAGVCSIVSLAVVFFIRTLLKSSRKGQGQEILYTSAGFLLSVLPILLYFYSNDAISYLYETLIGFPSLLMLGHFALPFPQFSIFLSTPFVSSIFANYIVLFSYVLISIHLMSQLILKKVNRHILLKISLLVFGLVLFRSAIGRSGEMKSIFLSQPAILLLFIFFDETITRIKNFRAIPTGWNLLMLSGILAVIMMMFATIDSLKENLKMTSWELANFETKWKVKQAGRKLPQLDRGNIYYTNSAALTVQKIDTFLSSNTSPDDEIYFFPNEPAYYFLFNRKNPTRYAMSYIAITKKHRLELINDLKRKKIRYVVYSLNTLRVDNINERKQVPEIVDFLRNSYRIIKDFGDIYILERG